MTFCFNCGKNVSGKKYDKCKTSGHDLDYENLHKGSGIKSKKKHQEKDSRTPSRKAFDLAMNKVIKLVINENNTDNSCSVIYEDENFNSGTLAISEISSGSKQFSLDVANLEEDKTYRLRLRQNGANAYSSYIQFRKIYQIYA